MSLFYSEVKDEVKHVLDTRKSIYAATDRSSGAHKWLYQKMAWASAYALNDKTGKSKSLTPPTGGGLGGNRALYKLGNIPSNRNPSNRKSERFIPKPHLDSVKITAYGDFGSLLKCDVSFTVHSLSDLDLCQPFFDLGADLAVEYGWNEAGSAGGRAGKFVGKIYNFSYALQEGGSFSCTSNGIGAGLVNLAGQVQAGSAANGAETTDGIGNTIQPTDLTSLLDLYVSTAKGLEANSINTDGIGCVEFPGSWTFKRESGKKEYYISLEKFIDAINSKLLRAAAKLPNEYKFICNSEYTKGSIPAQNLLVPANPRLVLFPGLSGYAADALFFPRDYAEDFISGDLSKIMININWLKAQIRTAGELTIDYQKNPDKTVAKLISNVLDAISDNSGGRFKLSCVSNPDAARSNEIIITDTNAVDSDVKPYTITAVTQGSICRSVNLVSKLPSEMAAAAFVGNTNTFAPLGAVTAVVNKTAETAGPNKSIDFDKARVDFDKAKLAIAKGPGDHTDKQKLDAEWLGLVSNMKSAIARVRAAETAKPTNNVKEAAILPLEFSCTLDGIEGFLFGNTIDCNYIPAAYKHASNEKIAFTITAVEHNIINNDWTTTLNTVCRVLPE
jgi:hypothetical protein